MLLVSLTHENFSSFKNVFTKGTLCLNTPESSAYRLLLFKRLAAPTLTRFCMIGAHAKNLELFKALHKLESAKKVDLRIITGFEHADNVAILDMVQKLSFDKAGKIADCQVSPCLRLDLTGNLRHKIALFDYSDKNSLGMVSTINPSNNGLYHATGFTFVTEDSQTVEFLQNEFDTQWKKLGKEKPTA